MEGASASPPDAPPEPHTASPMMGSMGVSCTGRPLSGAGGTWKGHVLPGIVFLSWGLYWAFWTFRRHLRSKGSGRSYRSKAWYPFLAAGRWLFALEPLLKVIGGPIGVSIELYFDSPDGFRPLYCSDTGRFAPEYVHNYQHASSYPGFLVSGLVDFLGMYVKLPPGTEQVFLSLAFGIEGFLMVLHKKHVPLDMITHELLGYTMLACALGVMLELRAPNNFLASVFRSFAVVMQGVWLTAMGQMMFTHSKAWNDEYSGPAMMAPPLYAMLALNSAVGLLLLYLVMEWWHKRNIRYTSLPHSSKADTPEDPQYDSNQYGDFSLDDSANETSDDGTEIADFQAKPKGTRHQLVTAFNMIKPSPRQSLGKSASKLSEHVV